MPDPNLSWYSTPIQTLQRYIFSLDREKKSDCTPIGVSKNHASRRPRFEVLCHRFGTSIQQEGDVAFESLNKILLPLTKLSKITCHEEKDSYSVERFFILLAC
jgi:hypothetical protein